MIDAWHIWTSLGGGKELIACIVINFIWFPRSKCFYYLAIFSLDKLYISFFKLAYADPRPYMIDGSISPISCPMAFGNPSNHDIVR